MTSYQTLWPYLRRYRRRLILGLLALIVVDLIQLTIPRVIKYVVDHLAGLTATPGFLAKAGTLIVLLAMIIGLFRFIWRQLIFGFSRIVEEDLRNRLYGKLLLMSSSWFMKRPSGDIMARATNDLEAVRMASGMGLVAMVDAIVMGAASIGFMIWINIQLTLLALIPMPLIVFLTRYFGGVMYRRYLNTQNIFGEMTERVREYLSGIRVIQAYVRENMVLRDMDRLGRKYVRENIRLTMVSGSFFPMMLMFTNLSTAIVIYFGGRQTIFQNISPGDFVAFISYLGLLTWPMMALGWVTNLVQRGAAALERINQVVDQEPDIVSRSRPVLPLKIRGHLEIRHLTFAYPGRGGTVLRDLSLSFQAGRTTALVGRTGSGKSTVLNLVPRLFDPPRGTIFLDGVDITDLNLSDLRAGIGYVPQDGYLFSGTVAENLVFGRPASDEAKMRAAARAAELEEDIRLFPDGYQTIIGERGVTLSGGQRQRLALARALLIDPPLLILDDTFSAVDAATEEKILANLARIRAGRTTILVSHRLTSLAIADFIHVIDHGRLVQSGRHHELVVRDGYYALMYRLQQFQAQVMQSGDIISTGRG